MGSKRENTEANNVMQIRCVHSLEERLGSRSVGGGWRGRPPTRRIWTHNLLVATLLLVRVCSILFLVLSILPVLDEGSDQALEVVVWDQQIVIQLHPHSPRVRQATGSRSMGPGQKKKKRDVF